MALNKVFQETQANNRPRVVPSGTKAGDPLIVGDRPAVALTDRGEGTRTLTSADGLPANVVSLTYKSGGASLASDQATVAFDGTFEFAVTGATATQENDVPVYITSAGELTLTEGSNTAYGFTDYPESFNKTAGRAAVRIGA